MAITITKYPEGFYPAYNDSFIEFSSDLINNIRAEITVYPVETFPRVFIIYPDADGIYLFNLKEAVKVIFNENGFEDANFFNDKYYDRIDGLYLNQEIDIKVLSLIDEEETNELYEFFKAVKQIGESVHSNPYQLLTYTPDGINHELTYFEGFPFHFDILRTSLGSNTIVKSLNTGNETEAMNSRSRGAFRVVVDKGGGNNWTSDNFLPLIEGLNRLEIHEGSAFKSNLLLVKKKKCSGVYLKWFNRSGGFSHYLFNEYLIERLRGQDIGKVFNDEFLNVPDATGSFKSGGKKAVASLNIKVEYESRDYEVLKDIFISPLVQLYTSRTAYIEGSFIDVFVDGNISFSNKRGKNQIALTVVLPEVLTAKL